MTFSKSLLVSNILDPLTHDTYNLQKTYNKLAVENNYSGIETRIIKDEETHLLFKTHTENLDWDVVFWITGEMSRTSLNLSSLNKDLREKSIMKVFEFIDLAFSYNSQKIGLGSGRIESFEKHDEQLKYFATSLKSIMDYIEENNYSLDIIVEPLDQFSHKKNVVGTLSTCLNLIKLLRDNKWIEEGRFSLCWDSAHFALNRDNFEESIKVLSPYVSRIHFSDAILDENHPDYGDNHLPFDSQGFMNLEEAKRIINLFRRYKDSSKNIHVACEVRTKNIEDAWKNEKEYDSFLNAVLERN